MEIKYLKERLLVATVGSVLLCGSVSTPVWVGQYSCVGRSVLLCGSVSTPVWVGQYSCVGRSILLCGSVSTPVWVGQYSCVGRSILLCGSVSTPVWVGQYSCVGRSVLLCGSEAWTLTKSLEKQLNSCYTRILRMVFNVHWKEHVTNEELCGTMMSAGSDLLGTT